MNISLRAYYKEIDSLIMNGEFQPAIDHCNAILETYPQNFEAYRLLGKALLEDRKVAKSADVFNKVLEVRPDDFIANIGLSAIREEEGNLESAIRHMERAFEQDSSLSAVQAELIRLYTLRDGASPQKIQLTNGALVRMYVRGGMYQQAITEIQEKFPDLGERLDLQVLLAALYFETGKIEFAVGLCRRILTALPNSFDANLILLKSPEFLLKIEDIGVFKARLIESDPYFSYAQEPDYDVSRVPDESIMLTAESLVLAAQIDSVPTAPSEEHAEDNLSGMLEQPEKIFEESDQSAEPELLESSSPLEDSGKNEETAPAGNLPEWMAESGWKPEIEHEVIDREEPSLSEAKDVLPADIPDWVKDMAPEAADSNGSPQADLSEKDDISTILFTDLESATAAAGLSDDVVTETTEEITEEELPESDHASAETIEEQSTIPEWLQGFDPSQETLESVEPDTSMPDWLKPETQPESVQSNPFTLDDLPDLTEEESAEPIFESSTEAGPAENQNGYNFEKPEWLNETSVETDINSLFEQPEAHEPEEFEQPDWLNNLRTGTSEGSKAQTGELKTEGNLDWLQDSEPKLGDTQPIAVNRPAETPIVETWADEQVEEKFEPELPGEQPMADTDLDAFFKQLDQHEKQTGEFSSETLEPLPFDFQEPTRVSDIETVAAPPDSGAPTENIAAMIEYFQNRIQDGHDLPAIISDIKLLANENPSEPGIWLLLGDAYHHNKQIQAALDAYVHAEESLIK